MNDFYWPDLAVMYRITVCMWCMCFTFTFNRYFFSVTVCLSSLFTLIFGMGD